METRNFNTSADLADDFYAAADAERIRRVTDEWGEGFADLALNPRLTFGAGEVEIRLWSPIRTSDGETKTLTMREPKLTELSKMDAVRGAMAQTKRVIMSACSLTDREAGELGLRDVALLGKIIAAFTGAVPEIGETF